MATGGKLEVGIGADISELQKKIKEAEFNLKDLSKTKIEQIKIGLDTKAIDANIKSVKQELTSLKTTLKDTGSSFTGMAPKVANGSNALLQFSRIAQDAPYGIIGIGNNLTATAEAFGHLKNQTGSTGGALKALGSSILGSGGVLLGISLFTTGLTYLAQSGLSVGDIIDKLTGNFDEFGNSIRKASEEAVKSASSEIASMNALVAVAQNKKLADEDRLIAVEKLQKQYVITFGNLSEETILNGNLEKAIRRTTDAILAQSRAKAYTSLLDDLSLEQIKTYTKLQDVIGDLARKYKVGTKDLLGFQQAIKQGKDATDDFLQKIKGSDKIQLSVLDMFGLSDLDTAIDLYKKVGEQNGKAYRLGLKIASETGKGIILEAPSAKSPKAVKATGGATPQVSQIGGGLQPSTELVVPKINTDEIIGSFKGIKAAVDTTTLEMEFTLAEFSNSVNELVDNSLGGAFASLGEAIGGALANGGDVLSAIGSGLLQSLGSFLGQLGDRLITYGLLLVGFGKAELAFKVGDPVTKIGAGLAMVGLGIAAKVAGSAVSSAGSKGLSGGGSGASSSTGSDAGSRSFSTTTGGGYGNGGGTVVFEIAGDKLIGVLANTQNRNLRIGGA